MEKQTLFKHKNVSINLEFQSAPDVVLLLTNTIWGTPGGTLYRHLESNKKITSLKDAWFLTLRKSGKLIGTMGLLRRPLLDKGRGAEAYFLRYFSFESRYQTVRSGKSSGNSGGFYHSLTKYGHLGLMQKVNDNVSVDVIAKYHNISNEPQAQSAGAPAYICAYDIT